jgi:hydrogenase maturation protein HypF
VASCAAEHGVTGPVIGVAYDGLGMGDDGTLWGGEVFVADLTGYRRVARFGRAPMPGGAAAVRRPARMALGYLFGAEALGGVGADETASADGTANAIGTEGAAGTEGADDANAVGRAAGAGVTPGMGLTEADLRLAAPFLERLPENEVVVVSRMVARGVNSPVTSSAGRLFDAAAAILGLRDDATYEGEAAVALEAAAWTELRGGAGSAAGELPWRLTTVDGVAVYDPVPTLAAVLAGVAAGRPVGWLAAAFHRAVAAVTVALCEQARQLSGLSTVCLSGGVFQNTLLTELVESGLSRGGFAVHLNERVPCNDGGISYGQAAVAACRLGGG